MDSITVTPAYGRDYTRKVQALDAWNAGLDFIEARTGRYVNRHDAPPGTEIRIRYHRMTKIVLVPRSDS